MDRNWFSLVLHTKQGRQPPSDLRSINNMQEEKNFKQKGKRPPPGCLNKLSILTNEICPDNLWNWNPVLTLWVCSERTLGSPETTSISPRQLSFKQGTEVGFWNSWWRAFPTTPECHMQVHPFSCCWDQPAATGSQQVSKSQGSWELADLTLVALRGPWREEVFKSQTQANTGNKGFPSPNKTACCKTLASPPRVLSHRSASMNACGLPEPCLSPSACVCGWAQVLCIYSGKWMSEKGLAKRQPEVSRLRHFYIKNIFRLKTSLA